MVWWSFRTPSAFPPGCPGFFARAFWHQRVLFDLAVSEAADCADSLFRRLVPLFFEFVPHSSSFLTEGHGFTGLLPAPSFSPRTA